MEHLWGRLVGGGRDTICEDGGIICRLFCFDRIVLEGRGWGGGSRRRWGGVLESRFCNRHVRGAAVSLVCWFAGKRGCCWDELVGQRTRFTVEGGPGWDLVQVFVVHVVRLARWELLDMREGASVTQG